jgi:hypothetical protein
MQALQTGLWSKSGQLATRGRREPRNGSSLKQRISPPVFTLEAGGIPTLRKNEMRRLFEPNTRDVGARQVLARDPHRGLLSGICHFRF